MTQAQREHGTVQHMMDKLQNMLGGLVGRATAAAVTTADAFVENAAIGDLYEIQSSKLALRRATSPQVKELAAKMITDHTTSTHHLKAALEMNETRGVKRPPTELDARRRKMLDTLDAAPSDKFDAMYLDQQVMAHQEALTLMTRYFSDGDNPQLRSVAAGAAPVIYRHLAHVKALKAKLPS